MAGLFSCGALTADFELRKQMSRLAAPDRPQIRQGRLRNTHFTEILGWVFRL